MADRFLTQEHWSKQGIGKDDIPGYVYFFACPALGLVKIGFAVNPVSRWHGGRSFCPLPMECLGWFPGTPKSEREVHARFHRLNREGEWFLLDAELAEFIATNVLSDSVRDLPRSRKLGPGGRWIKIRPKVVAVDPERAEPRPISASPRPTKTPKNDEMDHFRWRFDRLMKLVKLKALEAFEESPGYWDSGWEDRPLFVD